MLSHKTTGKNEDLAYARMWEKFGSWEAIRDAPTAELIEAISPANYPEVKAPNIQKALAAIIAERGAAEIDFLSSLPTQEALDWLDKLPGVGVKTATLPAVTQDRLERHETRRVIHGHGQNIGISWR
jgi:endonuclease-3